jgi:hypothetical protein
MRLNKYVFVGISHVETNGVGIDVDVLAFYNMQDCWGPVTLIPKTGHLNQCIL